jgi:DNA polymerase-3 subunit alpha
MGIAVLPPDVQKSEVVFSVESPVGADVPELRFGLLAIKNAGSGAIESIIAARANGPFESLADLCARIDTRLANKRVVESLIKAGAMDGFMPGVPVKQARPRLIDQVDNALTTSAKLKEDKNFATFSLFGEDEIKSLTTFAPVTTTSNAEWTDDMMLSYEKEVLGMYLSGHPLVRYRAEMATYTTCSIARLPDAGTVRIAGHVLSVRRMTTKKGNLMARFVLEDLEGEVEVTIFPKGLTPEVNALLTPGAMLVVKGQVENREGGGGGGGRQLLVEELLTFVAARERFVRLLTITIAAEQADDTLFNRLKEVFGNHPGLCRVHLRFPSKDGAVLIETKAVF